MYMHFNVCMLWLPSHQCKSENCRTFQVDCFSLLVGQDKDCWQVTWLVYSVEFKRMAQTTCRNAVCISKTECLVLISRRHCYTLNYAWLLARWGLRASVSIGFSTDHQQYLLLESWMQSFLLNIKQVSQLGEGKCSIWQTHLLCVCSEVMPTLSSFSIAVQ